MNGEISHGANQTASLNPYGNCSSVRQALSLSSFLIGQPGMNAGNTIGVTGASEVGRSPWIYISVDGQLQSYRLYVYSVSQGGVWPGAWLASGGGGGGGVRRGVSGSISAWMGSC